MTVAFSCLKLQNGLHTHTVNSFVRIKTFVQQNLNKKIIKEGQKYISYPLQLKPMEINKREKNDFVIHCTAFDANFDKKSRQTNSWIKITDSNENLSTRTDDKCTIPISTSLTSPVQSIITIISWLTHLGSVKQSIYTNFIYFSERQKDESTSSCSPAVLELTIVFLLRGIYSYFLNSRGILSTWNDKTKTY